jgi:hypothetical protein
MLCVALTGGSGRIAITFLSGPKETLWWQLVTCSTH